MHHRASVPLGLVPGLALLRPGAPAAAFSVLAHQAVIDRSWDDAIVPALCARFPDATDDRITRARAFAYGGSHVHDLDYFPSAAGSSRRGDYPPADEAWAEPVETLERDVAKRTTARRGHQHWLAQETAAGRFRDELFDRRASFR